MPIFTTKFLLNYFVVLDFGSGIQQAQFKSVLKNPTGAGGLDSAYLFTFKLRLFDSEMQILTFRSFLKPHSNILKRFLFGISNLEY